jgi:hypothetical protein
MKERNKQATPGAAPPKGAKPPNGCTGSRAGDYAADRRYRERTDRLPEREDVEEIARAAVPHSEEEAREMREAEKEGRSHADLSPKRKLGPADDPAGGKRGRQAIRV